MEEPVFNLLNYRNELLSDGLQEVISYRPHWIVRRGNVVFSLIILLLFSLTWVIRYPDIVNGTARLVALNTPKLITSKARGKLMKLSVSSDQQVNKGEHLGYIENTADYKEVMCLQRWIDKAFIVAQNKAYDSLLDIPLPLLSNLGDLQGSYQSFQSQMTEMEQTMASGYYRRKMKSLEKDLLFLSTIRQNALQQQDLIKQDQQLEATEYKAYESLAHDKVIAPLELNQYKSKIIAKEQSLKQVNVQITNSDIGRHNKLKEIMDLQKQVVDEQQRFIFVLLELKSKVEEWVQQYVLVAPLDGRVLFVSSLQENEFISDNQSLFFIQPPQSQFYAEIMVGQKGLGKIKVGQKVIIKPDSYPSEEFGYLTGQVNYISNLATRQDSFLIKVDLADGLQTNYGRRIEFRNDLYAKAMIITNNMKLIDHLAGQLRHIWER